MNEDALFKTSETPTGWLGFVSKGEKSFFRYQICKTVDSSLQSLQCKNCTVQLICTAAPQAYQVHVMLHYRQAVLYIQSDNVCSAHIIVTQKRIGLQCVQK